MNNQRTPNYVGTIHKDNPKSLIILKRLRAACKGTEFRLKLHGRGSREPMKALGYDAYARQSDLPLYLANKIDVYVTEKTRDYTSSQGFEDRYADQKNFAKQLRRVAAQGV